MVSVDMVPNCVSKKLYVSIQWTSIVLAVYYGIHVIFMSTLSADLTINEPAKSIEKLQDLLYDGSFQSMRPTMLSQLNMLGVLETSAPGSDERLLLDRARESNSTLTFDLRGFRVASIAETAMQVMVDMANHTRAFIGDRTFFDPLINHGICHMLPIEVSKLAKKGEPVFDIPQAVLISHSTHAQIVKLFAYRLMTITEFAMFKAFMRDKLACIMDGIGVVKSLEGYQCADVQQGTLYRDLEPPEWNPLHTGFFNRFIRILCSMIGLAMVVLFFECIHWQSIRLLER